MKWIELSKIRRVRYFLIMLFTLLSGLASADSKLDCYKLFYSREFEAARPACAIAAGDGHAYGKYLLGVMHLRGLAGPKQEKAGMALIAEGAEAGISDAQRDLGMGYRLGVGLPVDYERALYWYKKSAAANNYLAMSELAGMYLLGLGTKEDPERGYAYATLSADRGNEKAKLLLKQIDSSPEITEDFKKRAKKIRDEIESTIGR